VGAPFSLIALDVNQFEQVNLAKGYAHGDALLRWIAMVLAEQVNAPVYRLGGDTLAVALTTDGRAQHAAIARRIFDRLNREAARFETPVPVATVTVIHYAGDAPIEPADVWSQLDDATKDAKVNASGAFQVYAATDLKRADQFLRETLGRMVERIASLGALLDESHQLALTDPVTGLPNMLAAQQQLEAAIARATPTQPEFAILMIDGDNLGAYNDVSYALGDEMIRSLGATLSTQLRPGDFLARWRVGDEFLVILGNVSSHQGLQASERFCAAIHQQSQHWQFPITISIGVAAYPQHGTTGTALLECAEAALKRAKETGKNKAVLAM
jgi:diguanylate cyclase (GGDEF)-like protein